MLFDNEIEKRELSEETKAYLLSLSEAEKNELLNAALVANSISSSTPQNSLFLYFLLNEKLSLKQRREYYKKIKRIEEFFNSIDYLDKQVFKYGILNKFESGNPIKEYWNFVETGSSINNFGEKYKDYQKRNKIVGMKHFAEVFGLAYKRIKRILENKNFFPKRF